MTALKHRTDSLRTVGLKAKLTPEQKGKGTKGGGVSKPRAPGAGRPRKDGTPARHYTPEQRALMQRGGTLPKRLLAGPPTDEERAAFLARYGEKPDGRLTPDEVYEELSRPIGPFDMEQARAVCDRIAEGYDPVWLKRHWPDWPGQRTWRSWITQDDVKDYLRQCREYLSEQKMATAERTLETTFEEVKSGLIPDKVAMAVMGGARYLAEHSQKFAEKRSPERYGQQLTVAQTMTGGLVVSVGDTGHALLEAVRATRRLEGPVIEGESEVV